MKARAPICHRKRGTLVRTLVCCSDRINSSGALGQQCGSQKADELMAEALASKPALGPAPKECDVNITHH